jgi:hypothetical protein
MNAVLQAETFPGCNAGGLEDLFFDDGPGWSEEVDRGTLEVLHEHSLAQLELAKREQRLAASMGRDRKILPNGEVEFQIHAAFYHYWGQRLGYECWEDAQFVKEFLRDNEDARVVNHSNKIIMGYRAAINFGQRHQARAPGGVVTVDRPDRKKFVKTYIF